MSPSDAHPRVIDLPGLRHVGRRVLWFDELPSTNDYTASLATDPANTGTVVVADFQTRGRGQYGRVWQSRPGTSLLLSVLLFPPPGLRRPVVLTAWVAVAVADGIQELSGAEARIKWPNDLLVGGKKACGILIEQGHGTVVGVGLNLNQTAAEFRTADLPDATSLSLVAAHGIDPARALRALLRHLDIGYDRLIDGQADLLEVEWRERTGLMGQLVVAELADGTTSVGHLRELGFDGIAIDDPAVGLRVHAPEVVRRLRKPSRTQ